MGITDKISGRVKQAAGDLTGSDSLKRQGQQEERKADAQAELAEERVRLEREVQVAQAEQDAARRRAAEAAQREFDKSSEKVARAQERLDAHERRFERKAGEVEDLELRTDSQALVESKTRDELYEDAKALGVEGRSDMTKDELAEEVQRRS